MNRRKARKGIDGRIGSRKIGRRTLSPKRVSRRRSPDDVLKRSVASTMSRF